MGVPKLSYKAALDFLNTIHEYYYIFYKLKNVIEANIYNREEYNIISNYFFNLHAKFYEYTFIDTKNHQFVCNNLNYRVLNNVNTVNNINSVNNYFKNIDMSDNYCEYSHVEDFSLTFAKNYIYSLVKKPVISHTTKLVSFFTNVLNNTTHGIAQKYIVNSNIQDNEQKCILKLPIFM